MDAVKVKKVVIAYIQQASPTARDDFLRYMQARGMSEVGGDMPIKDLDIVRGEDNLFSGRGRSALAEANDVSDQWNESRYDTTGFVGTQACYWLRCVSF